MNIYIRSTILYEREQEKLLSIAKEISEIEDELLEQKNHEAKKKWSDTYIERRLSPWKKFFYCKSIWSRLEILMIIFFGL